MLKKKVTIEDLARIVSKGFESVEGKVGVVESKMATRVETNKRFDEVNARLDHIEKLILADHKRRIEKLELDMRELKNALAM